MFYVYKSIQKGEEIMNENKEFKPYIPADKITPEFTVTSIIMGVILAVIFGAANAYLGLRVGMTVSASIPAAVISMGVIRKIMKKNSILESNMVQTIGSAGESLAAGAIFTMPALVLWAEEGLCEMPGIVEITLIALCGGVLGVLFMVPLRNALIVKSMQHFFILKELPAQMFFLQVKRVVQTLRQYSQVWESQRSLNLSLTV